MALRRSRVRISLGPQKMNKETAKVVRHPSANREVWCEPGAMSMEHEDGTRLLVVNNLSGLVKRVANPGKAR